MADSQNAAIDEKLRTIAERHGVGIGAVEHVFDALQAGGGFQAQFNHPELGGLGQWSNGGMLMIGDMFNNGLKAKVAALLSDVSEVVRQAGPSQSSSSQHQSQYQGSGYTGTGDRPTFQRQASSGWWPGELGSAAATGSQNDMRYAVFPVSRRLALFVDGKVTVYDTEDHVIGGFSQQQSGDQSISLTSQHGRIDLSRLKQVPSADEPTPKAAQASKPESVPEAAVRSETPSTPVEPKRSEQPATSEGDIFDTIERLAGLHAKGILSDEEYAEKKRELLSRL